MAKPSAHDGNPGAAIGKTPGIRAPVIGSNSLIWLSENPLTQKASVGDTTASPSGPPTGRSPGVATDPREVPVENSNVWIVPRRSTPYRMVSIGPHTVVVLQGNPASLPIR